jgi:hypothetical protein
MAPSDDPRDVVKVEGPDLTPALIENARSLHDVLVERLATGASSAREADCHVTITRKVTKSGSAYDLFMTDKSFVNKILLRLTKAESLAFIAAMRASAKAAMTLARNPR